MEISKRLQWIAIFGILMIFSFQSIAGILHVSDRAVFAQVISSAAAFGSQTTYVIVEGDNSAIGRLTGRERGKELCGLSESQANTLIASRQFTTMNLRTGERTVTVLDPHGSLSKTQLEQEVGSTPCRPLQSADQWLLILTGRLS